MRRACVLRQLGRCAASTPLLLPTACGVHAAGFSGARSRKLEGHGGSDTQARPITTSSHLHAPWKIAPPLPPSVHPHPHPHPHPDPHASRAFDALPASEQFRSVMRLLPNSVVVCTSACSESIPRGMTMSSFTSLSLRPTPVVTFNMATPSRTLDAVAQSREFNIHVLSSDGEGARVADWFRRGNSSDLGVFEEGKMREACGCEAVQGPEGAGAPLLRGRGVLYGMKCKVLDDEPNQGLVTVRDHVIVLAEVVDIIEGCAAQHGQELFGMAYADRRYRQLGGTIVNEEE